MNCPTLDLSGPWLCRHCQQEQRGGTAYVMGLKVICKKCAEDVKDAPRNGDDKNEQGNIAKIPKT